MFDSCIRGAADMFKALALGTKFVFVGRFWVWGLSIKGEIGVRYVMEGLLADFDILMNAAGFQCVDQITGEHIDSSHISASMIAKKSKL
jgi:isopentenyl diphosphate isomerase/L-lactate dehydrogenase-like FMN-dependent dehydrogenase